MSKAHETCAVSWALTCFDNSMGLGLIAVDFSPNALEHAVLGLFGFVSSGTMLERVVAATDNRER